MGASASPSGSRPSDGAQEVSTLAGFDPSRIEIYVKGCEAIIKRLEDAEPLHYAETLEELERRHDVLADEVRNIAGMVRGLANAIARAIELAEQEAR
jgi:bifunctional DNA-binding transcriptional regulator/antitoxin component of YhaV-PrlF toxin-antitoxin module